MQAIKVGMREFRANLPHYLLEVGEPIAVTRHHQTIGYFIPTANDKQPKDLSRLKQLADSLDSTLKVANINEDELIAEYRELRKQQK